MSVKPFLKWAGGKSQILNELIKKLPFDDKKITKYAEPFVGGGALLFYVLSNYNLKELYISDVNQNLITTYNVIKENVEALITKLKKYQGEYNQLNEEQKKEYYLKKRIKFNSKNLNDIETASLMIFLNKTCFNGLYRVNKKGEFNVPMGTYKNPLICDEENLKNVSNKLKNVKIVCGDYTKSIDFIDDNTFVYFDPPYRPLTNTSNFTSYTKENFTDFNQKELANFIDKLNIKKAKIMLSNSDPKNIDENDNFFDELYKNYNLIRINAKRMINSKAIYRGVVKEILVINYEEKL